jgi:hypothetical protein
LVGCSQQGHKDSSLLTREAENGAGEEVGISEPTSEQITAVQKEMADWADGRWTEYSATWSPESSVFILSATADSSADGTAVKGYCRILDDIASNHLPGVKVSAAVYFQSGAKIVCK